MSNSRINGAKSEKFAEAEVLLFKAVYALKTKHVMPFNANFSRQYPYAVKVWQNNWDGIKTMFEYSPEIRRLIYTTNAIEGFNNGVKRITKTKSSFPSDEALFKLLYLVSQDITRKWTMPVQNWSLILNQFLIYFNERLEKFL